MKDAINFITLRKRSTKLVIETMDIPEKEWQKVNLSIPKRKYNHVSVHENDVCKIEQLQKYFPPDNNKRPWPK